MVALLFLFAWLLFGLKVALLVSGLKVAITVALIVIDKRQATGDDPGGSTLPIRQRTAAAREQERRAA
jgi:hypothetical protein